MQTINEKIFENNTDKYVLHKSGDPLITKVQDMHFESRFWITFPHITRGEMLGLPFLKTFKFKCSFVSLYIT